MQGVFQALSKLLILWAEQSQNEIRPWRLYGAGLNSGIRFESPWITVVKGHENQADVAVWNDFYGKYTMNYYILSICIFLWKSLIKDLN